MTNTPDNATAAKDELDTEYLFHRQLTYTAELLLRATNHLSDDGIDYLTDALTLCRDLLDRLSDGATITPITDYIPSDINLDALAPAIVDHYGL